YLAFLGLFGFLISSVQVAVLERRELAAFLSSASPPSLLILFAYVASIATFYVGVSLFLQTSSAALLNISLLTSDVYATLFQVFVEGFEPHWLFFAAFLIIIGGVVTFNKEEREGQERARGRSGEGALEKEELVGAGEGLRGAAV
ncbi:hypothetical protein TeGR_g9424, partial [Tetraparma gracilis]